MELLAPAGNWAALQAAFANGADAVYMGGQQFNARHSAANFSRDEIFKAVEYARLRNKKIYLTINTLIDNGEFSAACDYAYEMYISGVDALIIQDLGLMSSLRRLLPQMPLHASTQMTVHNSQGAALLRQEGISRVVLARELSINEIRRIRQQTPGMEFEVFAHGALCFCYSGQCLLSSMVGGRSGNRGRCAQPCRLPYQLIRRLDNEKTAVAADGRYLLSPADLCAVDQLTQLREAGVTALKIEGRMKRAEYVAVVTSVYRQALDLLQSDAAAIIDRGQRKKLYQIFNRTLGSGYLLPGHQVLSINRPNNRGVLLGRVISHQAGYMTIKLSENIALGDGIEVWVSQGKGPSCIVKAILREGTAVPRAEAGQTVAIPAGGRAAPGDRVFKTHDEELISAARASIEDDKEYKLAVRMTVQIEAGKPLQLILEDYRGHRVQVQGGTPAAAAQGQPLREDTIMEKLGRLGGTPFQLQEYRLEYQGGLILPFSDLNDSRRRAVSQLLQLLTGRPEAAEAERDVFKQEIRKLTRKERRRRPSVPLLSIAVSSPEAARLGAECGADRVYIAWEGLRDFTVTREDITALYRWGKQRGTEIVAALPRIQQSGPVEPWKEPNSNDCSGFLVENLGALNWIRQGEMPAYGDYGLNCFNQYTLDWLLSQGLNGVCLSPELTLEQLQGFNDLSRAELLVHGDLTLMISASCPIEAALGGEKCGNACSQAEFWLRDEKGYEFPVATDKKCRFYVFNSRRLCLLDDLDRLVALGLASLRIEAWRDSAAQIAETVAVYRRALNGLSRGVKTDLLLLRKVLQQKQGFIPTKGHLYRGVL